MFQTSVAKTKKLVPASEVPKWAEFLSRWRKDFSNEESDHKNLMNMIGLVGYEVACLRWVVSACPFFGGSKADPPDKSRYIFSSDNTSSTEKDSRPGRHEYESVTREDFEKMSEDEKKKYRDWKSEREMNKWGMALPNMKKASPENGC